MASAYREPQMHSGEADKWLPKKLFSDLDVHAMLPTQEYTHGNGQRPMDSGYQIVCDSLGSLDHPMYTDYHDVMSWLTGD